MTDMEKIKQKIGLHVFDCLEKIINTPLPRIREDKFKNFYLPILAERLKSLDNKASLIWIKEVAGTGTTRVEVVNDADEVLFVVPGIEATVLVDNDVAPISLYEVITQANNLMRSRQNKKAVDLTTSKYSKFLSKAGSEKDIEEWRKIFERYGMIKPTANKSDDKESTVAVGKYVDDF